MRPPIKPGPPPSLQQPLRDIMRGVGMFAEITEDTLEPAASLLPGPVRHTFHGVLTSLEAVGSRAVTPPLDVQTIALASRFVSVGQDSGAQALVHALGFAWQKASVLRAERHFLFSEVIAARALNALEMADDLAPEVRGAMIFNVLVKAHPMGRMPGVEPNLPAEDETQVELFLFAALVWLFTERARTLDEEEKLLDLALALTMAKKEAVAQSFDDLNLLGHALIDLADHV
ncbi:MAG: hypothetical protein HKN27_09820 [Silicimonas sp.]|nr:hypothetical protein [Silicimonas sp.]